MSLPTPLDRTPVSRGPIELPELKLPRQIESDPRCAELKIVLNKDLRPIWDKSSIKIAQIPLSEKLESALQAARNSKNLEMGIDQIDHLLNNEKKGIAAVREKQGAAAPNRISRLLITANDGSERFYRSCESVLIRHSDRVCFLRVDAPSTRFAEKLFWKDRSVKAVLVTERDTVTQVLLSLLEDGPTQADRTD